jgi:hypothetical protein
LVVAFMSGIISLVLMYDIRFYFAVRIISKFKFELASY